MVVKQTGSRIRNMSNSVDSLDFSESRDLRLRGYPNAPL